MTTSTRIEHRGRVVTRELRTSAPPERVWQAWADPEKLSQWFTDDARGQPEAGGTYTWIWKAFGAEVPNEVVLAEPGERLALSSPSPGGGPPTLLEVTVGRDGAQTVVRVVNSGFPEGEGGREMARDLESGWTLALAILGHYLENYFGEPRSSFFAMQPARFAWERLAPYYRREELLARWLTASGGIGDEGEPLAIRLRSGSAMTGRVLARSEREVAVTWSEIRGVCELKAFNMGPGGGALAIRGCGWGLAADRARRIEEDLGPALGRLADELAAGS